MAVEDRIIATDDIPESADFYNIVDKEATIMPAEEPAATTATMAFIQGQDEALLDRQLEIWRLAETGIDFLILY